METNALTKCPICNRVVMRVLFELEVPELFPSQLYESIIVLKCEDCNHIFNKISPSEYQNILGATGLNPSGLKRKRSDHLEFKGSEVKPTESESRNELYQLGKGKIDIEFLDELTIKRAKDTSDLILLHSNTESSVLDIGCASGSLLRYLDSLGYENLFGIDRDAMSIKRARNLLPEAYFIVGEAENIPYEDASFDLVVLDQVLEHLLHPLETISEISRVLKADGKLIIGVPNVDGYDKHYFFEHYWFLMKGHIQHFGEQSLGNLLGKKSFKLREQRTVQTVLNSSVMTMPNLISLFERAPSEKIAPVQEIYRDGSFNIDNYLKDNWRRGNDIRRIIDRVVDSHKDVYCWGLSREFQYLTSNSNLLKANIKELIDSDESIDWALQEYNFDFPIRSPHLFSSSSAEELLIVTATAHHAEIARHARELGFQGEIISLR